MAAGTGKPDQIRRIVSLLDGPPRVLQRFRALLVSLLRGCARASAEIGLLREQHVVNAPMARETQRP